jgi:hypothetical protein
VLGMTESVAPEGFAARDQVEREAAERELQAELARAEAELHEARERSGQS